MNIIAKNVMKILANIGLNLMNVITQTTCKNCFFCYNVKNGNKIKHKCSFGIYSKYVDLYDSCENFYQLKIEGL